MSFDQAPEALRTILVLICPYGVSTAETCFEPNIFSFVNILVTGQFSII